MRHSHRLGGCLVVAFAALAGCGKKSPPAEAQVAVSASAEAPAAGLRAKIGGSLVGLGDHVAELLLYAGGRIEAVVTDQQGQPLATSRRVALGHRRDARRRRHQRQARVGTRAG